MVEETIAEWRELYNQGYMKFVPDLLDMAEQVARRNAELESKIKQLEGDSNERSSQTVSPGC